MYKGEMCEKKIKLTPDLIIIMLSTIGIANSLLTSCQKGHSWNVHSEEAPVGGYDVDKFTLNHARIPAMQSKGSGGLAADTILAHRNIAGTSNFFPNLTKVRKTKW